MSGHRPAVYSAVSEMEEAVANVGYWGELLIDLGCSDSEVSAHGLHVVGYAVKALGEKLDAQWKAAFEEAKKLPRCA